MYKYSKIKSLNDEYIDINTIYKDRIIDVNIYIENIKTDTFFAGDFEIVQNTQLFKINILIFKKNIDNNNIKYEFYAYHENININNNYNLY